MGVGYWLEHDTNAREAEAESRICSWGARRPNTKIMARGCHERRCFEYVFRNIEECADSVSGSLRGCFSNSEYSSPSSSATAVSKNHMFFLMKCTTTVPPTR